MRSVINVSRFYGGTAHVGRAHMGLLIRQRLAASGRSAYDTATSVSRYMRNSYTHSFRQSSSLGSLSKRISRHSLQVRHYLSPPHSCATDAFLGTQLAPSPIGIKA